jgi:hypothetical protein
MWGVLYGTPNAFLQLFLVQSTHVTVLGTPLRVIISGRRLVILHRRNGTHSAGVRVDFHRWRSRNALGDVFPLLKHIRVAIIRELQRELRGRGTELRRCGVLEHNTKP